MEKLIDKYSIGPDISFRSVYVMNEALGSHIDRTSYSDIPKILSSFNSEPKISYFVRRSSIKNICWFDIPMKVS